MAARGEGRGEEEGEAWRQDNGHACFELVRAANLNSIPAKTARHETPTNNPRDTTYREQAPAWEG